MHMDFTFHFSLHSWAQLVCVANDGEHSLSHGTHGGRTDDRIRRRVLCLPPGAVRLTVLRGHSSELHRCAVPLVPVGPGKAGCNLFHLGSFTIFVCHFTVTHTE